MGTVIDVTERKKAEEKIREQEMEFRQILDLCSCQRSLDGGIFGLERLLRAGHVYGFTGGTGVECDIDGGRSFGADVHIGLGALLEVAGLHNNRVLARR